MFSTKSFIVVAFKRRSLIHFELVFVYGVKIQLYSFACIYPVFSPQMAKEIVLSPIVWFCHLYFIRIVLKDKRAMSGENTYMSDIVIFFDSLLK